MNGYWFIDGIDTYLNFGLGIEEGSTDVLRYPPKKESITYDWQDAHGVEVDLTKVFFAPREISLRCWIIAPDEAMFWNYHDAFITQLTKPGLHRLEITAHGARQYFVYYKDCTNYTQPLPLTGDAGAVIIGHKFTLVLSEPEPKVRSVTLALGDEIGRFIVT